MIDLTKIRPLTKISLDDFGAPGESVYVRSLSRAEIKAVTDGHEDAWEQTRHLLALAVCDGNGSPCHKPDDVDNIPVALVEKLAAVAAGNDVEAAKKK